MLARPLFSGTIYTADDLGDFYLPVRYFYHNALTSGNSFLWSPAFFSGFYIGGEGQGGMLHPLHLLLYRALPLPLAFNLEFLISYLAMFPGMFVLLRRLDLPRAAALFGALLFTFSGFNLSHSVHLNCEGVVAHIPWLLVAIDVLLRTESPRTAARASLALSLLTASQLLIGYPQYVWFSLLAEGAFALWRLRAAVSPRRVAALLLAKVSGGLIGAVQLLPTAHVLAHSVRSAPNFEFRMRGSLAPLNLVQLWAPYALKNRVYGSTIEGTLYTGAFCTVAPAWLLAARGRLGPWRGPARAVALFTALMLVLALGRYGGFYPLVALLPGVNKFRISSRHIVLVHLAMATFAGIGMAILMELRKRKETVSWRELWPLALPPVLSLATLAATRMAANATTVWATLPHAAPGLLLILSVTVLVAAAARGQGWALPALVLLTLGDLTLWGIRAVWAVPPQTIAARIAQVRIPPGVTGRVAVPDGLTEVNVLTMRGLPIAGGYFGLNAVRLLAHPGAGPNNLSAAGIAWIWDGRTWRRPPLPPQPRARLVTEARISIAIVADIEHIDVARTALTDTALTLPAGTPGRADLRVDRPGHIEVETEAPTRQLLIVSESYDEGWQATEDDRPVPIHRVYGDLLGCEVSPGRHRLKLRFLSADLKLGASLSVIGLLGALTGALLLLRQKSVMSASEEKG
jgi:hypothetical protein